MRWSVVMKTCEDEEPGCSWVVKDEEEKKEALKYVAVPARTILVLEAREEEALTKSVKGKGGGMDASLETF